MLNSASVGSGGGGGLSGIIDQHFVLRAEENHE